MKVKLMKVHCLRCGHEWHPRYEEVRICPKCKSSNFDRPKNNNQVVSQGNNNQKER